MKFDQAENSNCIDKEQKHKTRGVIILTDNRPRNTPEKKVMQDLRQSAFKQTQIDPFQVWADIAIQNDEDQLLQTLNRKLHDLEQRVKQLEKNNQMGGTLNESQIVEKDKKARRKFAQMERNLKCPFEECGKIYGSQTSLRHHLKLKHKIYQKQSEKENSNKMEGK